MTTAGGDEDDRLLDLLRQAVRHAGTPTPTMIAAGEAALSWRTVDEELAALTSDSLAAGPAPVRNTATAPRTLVFEGARQSVEVTLTDDGLLGQLVPPPATGEVTLLSPGGVLDHADVDEVGCVRFDPPPGGEVRLRCRTPSGVLVTGWIAL